MKNDVLGPEYELSLVFVSDKRARELNQTYRKKNYTPNVLSFSIAKNCGEIFINLKQAQRERKERGESYRYFVGLLFIHALLHLKGYPHGSTMERQEAKLLLKFRISNTKDRR